MKKIGVLNVEIRSALYEGITDVSDNDLREHIRKFIDRFYNEKNGVSASGGRGLFSIMDQNPNSPPLDDEKQDKLADAINPPEGKDGKVILHHIPEKYKELSAVTLDDCLGILQLPDIQRNISSMRSWVRQIEELRKSNRKKYAQEYRELSKRLHAAIDKHEYDLSLQLESKIKLSDGTLFALVDPTSIGIAAGFEVAKGLVSAAINTQPWYIKVATDSISGVLGRFIPEWDELRMRTTAAGTIRQNLRKASFRNFM